jgi:hypothetical protein
MKKHDKLDETARFNWSKGIDSVVVDYVLPYFQFIWVHIYLVSIVVYVFEIMIGAGD